MNPLESLKQICDERGIQLQQIPASYKKCIVFSRDLKLLLVFENATKQNIENFAIHMFGEGGAAQ